MTDPRTEDTAFRSRLESAHSALGVTAWNIVAFDRVSSTMDAAAQLELPPGARAALFALEQSEGRGREGRQWSSGRNRGVYATYAVHLPPANVAGLSLAAGLAVKGVLSRLGVLSFLKWPNDVLAGKPEAPKKIAGILVDVSSAGESQRALIGVGINLEPHELPEAISIAELKSGGAEYPEAAAALTYSLDAVLARFQVEGFAPFVEEWNSSFYFQGRPVSVVTPSGEKRGTALGAAADGALILESGGAVEKIYSGTLRG